MPRPRTLKLLGTTLHPSFYQDKVQHILEPLRKPVDEKQLKRCSPLFLAGDIVDLDSLVVLLRRAAGEPADFTTRDIRHLDAFLITLRASGDGLAQFLWQKLSSTTRTLQSAELYTPAYRLRLLELLVKDLNRIIHGALIFNPRRDSRLQLASDTLKLLHKLPTGTGLIRLNRMLLEDAFPVWLKSARPSAAVVFLWDQLSDSTKTLVRNQASTHSQKLLVRLVEDLNRIIRSGPLFEPQRFLNGTLSTRTKELLKLNPQGDSLMKLNRFLLEDALPHTLRPNIYLGMSQADLDEFRVFPLALFEVVASFVEDPVLAMHTSNFSTAWQIEPKITTALLTAITEYVRLPVLDWTLGLSRV